ncbi:hypothetical protein [Streptomyces sp. NPDC059708]|uniref:hypothetical protein n=1 Tax=Streptomyces sp. NPDC059708 TaxID=3346916 RepID=UPI0036A2C4C7
MNTKAIGAASEVIFRALSRDGVVPATIAVALEANGLLAGPEAAELTRGLRSAADALRTQLEIAERRNTDLAEQLEERTRQLNGLLDTLSYDEKAVPA